MKNSPILIVAGEPYSIFIEIFLKAFNKIKVKKKIILIVSKKLFIKQMKKLNFKYQINLLDNKNLNLKNLSKTKINIIANGHKPSSFDHVK